MGLRELREKLIERARHKKRRAEQAFIKQTQAKLTENCRHAGKRITQGQCVCRVVAMGLNEKDAMSCHDAKAGICGLFEAKQSVDEAKQVFREMDTSELAVRWPSLGETLRIISMANDEQNVSTDIAERPRDGSSGDAAASSTSSVRRPVVDGRGDEEAKEADGQATNRRTDGSRAEDPLEAAPRMSVATVSKRRQSRD